MRVAYVSSHADFVGGGEYSLFDLMTHLPKEIEPVLLVPEKGALSRRADKEAIEWRVAPMPPIGWRTPLALGRWRSLLRELRPDILHANSSRAAFYAGMSGRFLGVPALFHCRVDRPDAKLDWLLARLADGVIANSEATARRFSAWPELRVWAVHNGVDVAAWLHDDARRSKKPFDAERVILMVARVSRWKRHDIALDVFARVAATRPGVHLVCVGGRDPVDTAWWNELRERTDDLPNGHRVHWVGEAGHDELRDWYATSDVLLLPSDNEPFGRVLVEAMAMGVPVVAFAGGGVPEVVEHGQQGLLVPAGDVEAMAEAVARLLEDDGLRLRMGEAGRKRARLFSIEQHVERICDIYREVLS